MIVNILRLLLYYYHLGGRGTGGSEFSHLRIRKKKINHFIGFSNRKNNSLREGKYIDPAGILRFAEIL